MTDRNGKEVSGETVIPVVQERVAIEKGQIEGRTVTVTTRPVIESQTISESVMRETVTVERVPVGKVVDSVPSVREEGDLTVVPVVEERLVVTRQLVLTEEIHLRRTRVEETDEQTIELRRTVVDIDE